MNRTFSKVSALIVLLAVALAFTGLPSFVSAAHSEKVEKSCCDECDKTGEKSKADNCSTPTCPLFLCLSMNVAMPFTQSIQTAGVVVRQLSSEFYLSTPTKAIFHPPVIS